MVRSRGYTLIELMVVIAILALSVSLVVPGFFNTLDNIRHKVELKEFRADFQSLLQQAFYLEQPLEITLRGTRLIAAAPEANVDSGGEAFFSKRYEYLRFREAGISVNRFGFIHPVQIQVISDDDEQSIQLP